MAQQAPKKRPKNLDLTTIRLPLAGKVSILHRVSGAGLFLFLPALLWLFQSSLATPESHAAVRALADFWLVKLVLAGLIWAYLHHFCAGIRFLLLDVHIGLAKETAAKTSAAVLAVSLTLTALIVWRVLL